MRDNPADALLLDLRLPDGNGLEVLDQVQGQFPALPVVILSGNDADELALGAVRRGVQDYLVKGTIDGQTLERSLRYAIERKRIDEILQAKIQEESLFQNYLIALHEITIELTAMEDVDEFYKRAVELGLQRLGFDRIGFLLYDPVDGSAVGTYGTDAQGQVVAEHEIRFDPKTLTGILMRAMQKDERFAVDEQAQLFSNFEPIGIGWNAAAVLWNGSQKLG